MKALIFCGYHNTGKTTLIEKAVKRLTRRGYSVITIKHTPKGHKNFTHKKESDTDLLLAAGSRVTIRVTRNTAVSYRILGREERHSAASLLHALLDENEGDFALIEGFKSYEGPIPRIIFGHTRQDIRKLLTQSTVAFSGWEIEDQSPHSLDTGTGFNIPYISTSLGADALADFIERHAREIET